MRILVLLKCLAISIALDVSVMIVEFVKLNVPSARG